MHHGRHFGRTVFALCNFHALLNNGILRMVELPDRPLESLSPEFVYLFSFYSNNFTWHRERRELKVFQALLSSVPGLEERLSASEDELAIVAELVSSSCDYPS